MNSYSQRVHQDIIKCASRVLLVCLILAPILGNAIQAGDISDLKLMTYNIRHGRGMDERVDLARTAATIAKYSPDIVALQEVDVHCHRSGNVDQPKQLGETLGMSFAFGSFMDFQGGKYGLAILSKFPIVCSQEFRLPDGNEPRVALVAELQLPDRSSVLVVNLHFDWVRDDKFRFSQAQALHAFLGAQELPYFLLGDFNDSPDSRTVQLFRSTLVEPSKPEQNPFTFSSTKPTREIDYVFISKSAAWKTKNVLVGNEPLASDHRPLLVELTSIENQQNEVSVRLKVLTPQSDEAGVSHVTEPQRVFAAGNLPALGNWNPNGLELKPLSEGVYAGQFQAPVGSTVQYKITQGSWQTVEKNATGADIANRSISIVKPMDREALEVEIRVEGWADSKHERKSTVLGSLEFHHEIPSQFVSLPRTVAVWLPPGYGESTDRYPVLYLQDGQNLFDVKTAAFGVEWQMDESATRLIEQELIHPLIIIGVWNTQDRIDEYTPTKDPTLNQGGRGEDYVRFLVEELKPMIDRQYRTMTGPESTLIGGSSLGGLISIHAWLSHCEYFGHCVAFSPSLHWDNERLLGNMATGFERPMEGRIWFSMGTSEGGSVESRIANTERARRLAVIIENSNRRQPDHFQYVEVEHGEHREAAWAEQIPRALKYLLGSRQKTEASE